MAVVRFPVEEKPGVIQAPEPKLRPGASNTVRLDELSLSPALGRRVHAISVLPSRAK